MRTAIRNGTVYDGTGAEGRQTDVLLEEGRIAAVGTVDAEAEELDAGGLAVARAHDRWQREGPYNTIESVRPT